MLSPRWATTRSPSGHYGASITKIILPAGLRSVSPEAFWKMGYLAEIEVPEGSATARSIG